MSSIRVPAQGDDQSRYWGIGLLALWIGTLQLALDLGRERRLFSANFITARRVNLGGGLVAFLWREWVAREPVVDLRVFKVRS
jgi:DHA2 family multidrug resistance protein